MDSAEIRAALAGRWPDDRFLHVYEAPVDSSRLGNKIDVCIIGLWASQRHEVDAVEVKVSYSDWCKEWRRVEWIVTDHLGQISRPYHRKPDEWHLRSYLAGGYRWRAGDVQPPDGFVPTVERVEMVDVGKNRAWRERAHRFWIACPASLSVRIAADVGSVPEMAGWGVLAVHDTYTDIVIKPALNAKRKVFSESQWIGLARAAADSGVGALQRAEQRGYQAGYLAGKPKVVEPVATDVGVLPFGETA